VARTSLLANLETNSISVCGLEELASWVVPPLYVSPFTQAHTGAKVTKAAAVEGDTLLQH
jgi:hypothetical protein